VEKCADFPDRAEAQGALREALDPPPPSGLEALDLPRRRIEPRVIKSLDPDGDGKACNKKPAWLPPGKASE
jgi:hypothetical protein